MRKWQVQRVQDQISISTDYGTFTLPLCNVIEFIRVLYWVAADGYSRLLTGQDSITLVSRVEQSVIIDSSSQRGLLCIPHSEAAKIISCLCRTNSL